MAVRTGSVAATTRSVGLRAGLSLRIQLALVIALLALIPNVVLILTTLVPAYRRVGALGQSENVTIILWLVGFVLVATITGYIMSGQLLAPLLRLTGRLAVLSQEGGHLAGSRLTGSPSDPDEIRALTGAFNELLEEVEGEQARRTAFSAALMHDLKTPLVAATNLLQVVRDDDGLTRESRVDVVGKITEELRSLIELVQKMVDAHRLERAEVPLAREHVELADLMRALVSRLGPLMAERGVSVTLTGEATAFIDRREVERALYNLLSNAARYAKQSILVDVFPGLVRISDDGPGLGAPLEELAQPFNDQGVDIAGRRYAAGAGGLGLFIARRVMEAHGGRLVSEASGPRGTVLLAYLGPR
ncbi:MAG TPA: ATP-binding protein [Trueperaceae bacterium]|nr:ATP-binding protein [Trueperaceae bacterium]